MFVLEAGCGDARRRRQNRAPHRLLLEPARPVLSVVAPRPWYDHFVDCFDHLADRIGAGDGDQERLATCTGEEMALHLAIDLAEALAIDELLDVDAVSSLPDHGADDGDFDTMRSLLFTDHAVLILFDPAMDGAEIPDSLLDRAERYANLHPRDWFKPFASN